MKDVLGKSCTILFLEESTSYGKSLAKVAIELGIDLTICNEFSLFSELANENQFDLAMVDIDSLNVEISLVASILNSKPLVVISSDALAETRRTSWPETIKGVFSTEVNPRDLLGAVLQLVPVRPSVFKSELHYLLIDDDESFAKIASRAASLSGIRLSWVDNLQKLNSNKSLDGFDVILLDYDLKETTGFKVAGRSMPSGVSGQADLFLGLVAWLLTATWRSLRCPLKESFNGRSGKSERSGPAAGFASFAT